MKPIFGVGTGQGLSAEIPSCFSRAVAEKKDVQILFQQGLFLPRNLLGGMNMADEDRLL